MNTWFVLYCKPGKDKVAESNLLSQDIEVYRPTVNLDRIGKNRIYQTRCESLFPRYLFIKVNPEKQALVSIANTRGICGFVKFGGKYSAIDERVIDQIKECELSQQIKINKCKTYVKGDPIYINEGSFNGFDATFIEKHGDDRVIVLLNMLGRMSKVEVPSNHISKFSSY